jgi:predicted ATPase
MGETLYTGELLRVRGEILLSMFQPDLAEVERVLTDALGWARQHMALSWELRAAMAMARLYSERRQASEAAAIIDQVLGQFREGYGTSDLVSARRFLDDLRT